MAWGRGSREPPLKNSGSGPHTETGTASRGLDKGVKQCNPWRRDGRCSTHPPRSQPAGKGPRNADLPTFPPQGHRVHACPCWGRGGREGGGERLRPRASRVSSGHRKCPFPPKRQIRAHGRSEGTQTTLGQARRGQPAFRSTCQGHGYGQAAKVLCDATQTGFPLGGQRPASESHCPGRQPGCPANQGDTVTPGTQLLPPPPRPPRGSMLSAHRRDSEAQRRAGRWQPKR